MITGNFNAEYGNAMSGVVNAVTKDGSNEYSGSINAAYSTYFTKNERNDEEVYIGLDPFGINSNNDIKLILVVQLSKINFIFLQIIERRK